MNLENLTKEEIEELDKDIDEEEYFESELSKYIVPLAIAGLILLPIFGCGISYRNISKQHSLPNHRIESQPSQQDGNYQIKLKDSKKYISAKEAQR